MADEFLTQASRKNFSNALRRVLASGKKSASSVVKRASIKFFQSARVIVKVGKRRRDIEQAPRWKKRSGRYKYRIIVRRQSGNIRYIYTNSKSDKRRIIQNRGLAKQSINWMMAGLGKTVASRKFNGVDPSRVQSVHDRTKNVINPEVEFENRLSYLLKVYPNVESEAMDKASKSMTYMLDKEVAPELEKDFK